MSAAGEMNARDAVVWPSLGIGAAAVGLPFLAAMVAPASVAGPLALAAAVVPFVLGFIWRPKGALLAFALYLLFVDTLAASLPAAFNYVDEVSISCLVLIALVRWRHVWRARIAPVRDGAVAVFLLAAILSSLLHAVPFDVSIPEFVLVAKGIAFFYLVSWIDHRPEDVRAYGQVLAGVAVFVLAAAALEYLGIAFVPGVGSDPALAVRAGLPSLRGPFLQPYHFAWFCAFVVSLAMGRFVIQRRWPSLALGFAALLGVILAGRRWSILAVVAALIAGVVLVRAAGRSWREAFRDWAAATLGSALLILVFLPSMLGLVSLAFTEYVKPAVAASSGAADNGESLLPRLALYEGSLKIARDDFPLGVGLGRYASWMSGVTYSPVYAQYGLDTVEGLKPDAHPYLTDTFWPQIIGEAGVIGLLGYGVFLACLALMIWRLIRTELARSVRDPVIAAFALGTGVAFAQCFVASIANTMYNHPPEAFVTFGLFGVAASLVWQRSRAQAQPQRVPPAAPVTANGRT